MNGDKNNDTVNVAADGFSSASDSMEALSTGEKFKLRALLWKCEKVIRRGRDTWCLTASTLMEIRDGRLYRGEGFTDFGRYCKERLHMGKSTLNRQIAVAEVYGALASTGAKTLPTSERMMRPLLDLREPGQETTSWRENVVKAWNQAVQYARDSKVEITEKTVKHSLHQLGFKKKPEVKKREVDLEKRWQRLEAVLMHEREFWDAGQRHDLSERISALVQGWGKKEDRVQHLPPVHLFKKEKSFATLVVPPELVAPTDAEAPIPAESIASAPPNDDDFTIERNRLPSPANLSEDVEFFPDEREPEPERSTIETGLKQVHGCLGEIAGNLQIYADNRPENLKVSDRFDVMEHIAGELEKLAQKLDEEIDNLIKSEDSGFPGATLSEILMPRPCFVCGPLPKLAMQLTEIIRFVAEAIKAEAPDVTANLREVAEELANITWP